MWGGAGGGQGRGPEPQPVWDLTADSSGGPPPTLLCWFRGLGGGFPEGSEGAAPTGCAVGRWDERTAGPSLAHVARSTPTQAVPRRGLGSEMTR